MTAEADGAPSAGTSRCRNVVRGYSAARQRNPALAAAWNRCGTGSSGTTCSPAAVTSQHSAASVTAAGSQPRFPKKSDKSATASDTVSPEPLGNRITTESNCADPDGPCCRYMLAVAPWAGAAAHRSAAHCSHRPVWSTSRMERGGTSVRRVSRVHVSVMRRGTSAESDLGTADSSSRPGARCEAHSDRRAICTCGKSGSGGTGSTSATARDSHR